MSTEAIERLGDLLAALTSEWQHRDWLLAALSENYPETSESASRMLVRDVRWLRTLGFQIERSEGHHEPHFRLVGHERFGTEVPSKFCKRCGQWRRLNDFSADKNRASKRSIYCRYCNRKLHATWQKANPGYRPAQKEWRKRHRERLNERWREQYRMRMRDPKKRAQRNLLARRAYRRRVYGEE